MPFDPAIFEAEVALNLIPTEGLRVVRMAILDRRDGWAIDQALPHMLDELGRQPIPRKEAALRLAHQRDQRILASGEDPLLSLCYFYHRFKSDRRLQQFQ